jgi:cytidine deaminase
MPRPASTAADRELIQAARDVIRRNYDAVDGNHTVGSALRCGSGAIHVGVNVYSVHGACAEVIAFGAAIAAGERSFLALASARGADGEELLPSCGNCRQMLCDHAPDLEVIFDAGCGPIAVTARELLPYAYRIE